MLRCPVCKKEAAWENNPYRPFCTGRCRLVDLGAWVDGRYSIAGGENDDDHERETGPEG
ncbi:MAG TPA: DNA gyrase inhibitor YacG [Nitrospirota bacterium]